MKGYWGKALMIDLAGERFWSFRIPGEWIRAYLGGEGLGVRLFEDLLPPEARPLEPDSPLIFATGPLSGTAAPASGRTCLVFHSPLTGGLGISNVGGHFGPALKRAGWDLLVLTGRAARPRVVTVDEERVSFLDGADLWGKRVGETEEELRARLEGTGWQIACIGPAGEKLSNLAAVMTDRHRAAGRGGPGAVMGSKNLKALAVRGGRELPLADPAALREVSGEAREELFREAFVRDEMKPFGTPSFYDSMEVLGILPTRNWQRDRFPESLPTLGHKNYHEKLEVKPYACFGCPIACGRHTRIREGRYAGMEGGGPEYEAVAAFGCKCESVDLEAAVAANHLANDLGLDVIGAGQTIATAMEWFEKGILTKERTDGLELRFGNGDAIVEMVRRIGLREGLGDLLAQGSLRAARELGGEAEKAVMHVKGMEMACDGVRASRGEALSHLISPRGADHLRPYASTIDAFGYREPELGIPADAAISIVEDGNKAWVKPLMANAMIPNLLGVCLFTNITLGIRPSTWAKVLSAAVGRTVSLEELLRTAERVMHLERQINARFGFDRKDDVLPERLRKEPGADGPGEGQVVDQTVLLDSFYDAMGWSRETGLPAPETLEAFGLGWMA